MSALLHTSSALPLPHAAQDVKDTPTTPKNTLTPSLPYRTGAMPSLVDTDGLRCEVRSMRSVPHALYALPSVSHVVAGYIRQLMDDFTTSLLMCRPARSRLYPLSGSKRKSLRESAEEGKTSMLTGAVVVAGAAFNEEETYLLLRLCAREARQRRRNRRTQLRQQQCERLPSSGNDDEEEEDEEMDGEDSSDRLWGSSFTQRERKESLGTQEKEAAPGNVLRIPANLTKVDDQLLELFAAVDEARRGGQKRSLRGTNAHVDPVQQQWCDDASLSLTPPLLASLLRYKPLLRDMQFIARHVLLPRRAWPHYQREWVSLYEDVSVTLADRLARYRTVFEVAAEGCDADGSAGQGGAASVADKCDDIDNDERTRRGISPTSSLEKRVVPAAELEQLWQTLWELLGAAWRQRDRLWGAYRYLHGARQLPPLSLNSHAATAAPPGVHASPVLRDHHTRHLLNITITNVTSPSSSSSSCWGSATSPRSTSPAGQTGMTPPTCSITAPHDEDSCAFGPFTASDIGVSAEKLFVLRQPLAAALRRLRVCVPAGGRDALATSTTAFAGFKYVNEPSPRRSSSPLVSPTPPAAASARPRVVVPLFDATTEDARLSRAVPYISPEVYVAQQQRRQRSAADSNAIAAAIHGVDGLAPVHSFSDDVWNSAVVVLEAALCGFPAFSPEECHLSSEASTPPMRNGREAGEDASPDAVPPSAKTRPSASPHMSGLTESVYTDVLMILAEQYGLAGTAAHNFLYAALYHLRVELTSLLTSGDGASSPTRAAECREEKDTQQRRATAVQSVRPSPACLAREWLRYLQAHYSADFVRHVLAGEVASKGLCWRRSERWNAFGMAHITATTTATSPHATSSASLGSVTSPLDPSGGKQQSPNSIASIFATGSEKDTPPHQQEKQLAPHSMLMSNRRAVVDASAFSTTPASLDERKEGKALSGQPGAAAQPRRLQARLTVALPNQLDTFSSMDVSAQNLSALQSPLRAGSPGVATPMASLARLPQKLDRAVNALDTPLLPLFGLPRSLGRPSNPAQVKTATSNAVGEVVGKTCLFDNRSDALWDRLTRFMRHRTTYAGSGSSAGASGRCNGPAQNGSGGGGSGSVGKANGAVADAADADAVEELLHLLYTCVLASLRHAGESADNARYAAVNHPFLRGVAERGLLTTYMAVCGSAAGVAQTQEAHAPRSISASMSQLLLLPPSLNLYVPANAVCAAMDRLEELDRAARKIDVRECKDRLAAASAIMSSLEDVVKRTGTLRTFIGDDVRAWEAARDVSRRARAASPSYYAYATQLDLPPILVNRARTAVDAVLSSMELAVPVQLHHIAALRRLIGEAPASDSTFSGSGNSGGGAGVASEVRCYLHTHHLLPLTHIENKRESGGTEVRGRTTTTTAATVSPFFAVPPTLRGVVWGCLLHVPPARRREAALVHALHRTAAKPSLNDRQLAVDIPRCHAYHPLLSTAKGSAQLQRLLKAWLFLHPRYAYWQGLDSVCAVLLTVSPHDEALVLAQLNAVVDQYIAHDEGGEEAVGSRSSLLQPTKPSMADQLHRLAVVLRYCDPLLAHYLFSVLGCTPELYAISWFLTVFSHSLPTRKVYLLWDLLFVYGDTHSSSSGSSNTTLSVCLVALCAAVMMHKRGTLLSSDFSGCLSAFSSGVSQLNVAAAVGDTRQLMAVLPPSVLAQPCAEEAGRPNASEALYGGGHSASAAAVRRGAGSAADATTLAFLSVEDLQDAWLASKRRPTRNVAVLSASAAAEQQQQQQRQHHWSDSGVYLVDIRHDDAIHDSLLGAVRLSLVPADATTTRPLSSSFSSSSVFVGRDGQQHQAVADRVARWDAFSNRREDNVEAQNNAGDGWGTVEDQERLQKHQQIAREAQERHIVDAAAELVRHLGNSSVAAIVPRSVEADVSGHGADDADGGVCVPPWPVHPIVLKTSMAPHVVLIASGGTGLVNAEEIDDEDMAHQLGLQLNACGVHNVSVLRGGVAAIRQLMPEMIVPHGQSS